jgi:fatty acid desaturase
MPGAQEINELQRRRRVSARNLRRSAIIFGATALVLLVLHYWLSMRLWMPFTVLGIVALSALGDVFTYFQCARKIRRLEHDRAS